MFRIGDTVVYGNSGVCRITDLREEKMGPVKQTYYVLQPLKDPRSTFYCPLAREDKLRPLLTEEQLHALIQQMPEEETVWIPEEGRRREQFNAMLKSGDHRQLIRLIKTLFLQRQEREAAGKRLHLSDQRILEEAEQVLYGEFAQVLDISPEQVVNYINEELTK